MKKFIFNFLIFSVSAGIVNAQDANPAVYRFTLEDCLEYAFDENYNRQSLILSEEASQDAYEQSKKERLPSVNASLSESFNSSKNDYSSWSGNYGVSASVALYKGGSINNTIEQSRLRVQQSEHQTSRYENNLTIQILQAFLTVLGNEELLKYQEAVITASEEQLNQGREQFNVGKILESDFLLLESQYANDKNNIVDTKINRDNNLLTLKSLLSMNPENDLQIIYPDTAALLEMSLMPPLSYVMERTIETLPDIKISQSNVEIAQVGVKLSKANYSPTISLNGSIGTGHSSDYNKFGTQLNDRLNEQIALSVSIPIFDNNRTKSKVTQSRIALQQAQLDQKQTELDVAQSIATEYQNVVSAYNKFQTTDIRQNAYLRTFEVYTAQFNAGSITAVDLLQQQNNYISALNDFIQSKYGFMLKRKILDVYMGEKITM